MISKKIRGSEATHHPRRLEIIFELGKMAAQVHTIPTRGYGHMFDWSQNALSKNESWKDFIQLELKVKDRVKTLKNNKLVSPTVLKKIQEGITVLSAMEGKPCLQHGDLRLKNVMAGEDGTVTALIDWENCISSIGSLWDISIALHDLSIDAQQKFIEGYGLSGRQLVEISAMLKIINILNYAPVIDQLCADKRKNKVAIEYYRARLHGALDLFSP